jgi:hypothetical protein
VPLNIQGPLDVVRADVKLGSCVVPIPYGSQVKEREVPQHIVIEADYTLTCPLAGWHARVVKKALQGFEPVREAWNPATGVQLFDSVSCE